MDVLAPFRWIKSQVAARLTSEPRNPDARRIGYTGRTVAGVAITHDTALRIATVWACHRYLTQTVAQLPVRVMKNGTKKSDPVWSHPVDTIFNWRANPELSPFQLKETLTGWAILRGNGVAEIERDNVGRVIAIWPIEPHRIQFRRDIDTQELIYRVDAGLGSQVDLTVNEVLHIRGFGHGPVGLNVVEYAAESLGWARATELFGASFFGNGMNLGGAVEIKGKGDPDSIRRMRKELDELHRGPTKANRWFFADGDAKVVKTTATPDEAQFVTTMQHQVEEICRWFGVPPHKVMQLLRATFSNIENQSIEVVQDSIAPWCKRWEEEATFKLFGQNRQQLYVKFDLKGLLRGDFKSRQEGLEIMRRNGIINANTWLDLEDMAGIGDQGEIYIVAANMADLSAMAGVAPASKGLSTALESISQTSKGMRAATIEQLKSIASAPDEASQWLAKIEANLIRIQSLLPGALKHFEHRR